MAKFEVNNNQRPYFGLNIVEDSWDKIEYPKGLICYYSGNCIRKVLINPDGKPNYYSEYDTQIETNERAKIIPKKAKGKEKPITPTTIYDYNEEQTNFHVQIVANEDKNVYITLEIGQQKLDLENNTDCFKSMKTLNDFEQSMQCFVKELPTDHLEKIQELKNKRPVKTKSVRFKSGDFFAVPMKFDLYGNPIDYVFGRHLLNISKLRKTDIVNKDHHWHSLMTVVQLVMMYDYNSPSLTQNLQELKGKPTTPSFHMMDDQLMRGEYPIVGNIPLEAEELSFPMHYGIDANKEFCFGWGICRVKTGKKFVYNENEISYSFSNNGVVYGGTYRLEMMRKNEAPYYKNEDIQHPENKSIKDKILESLGVKPDIEYDEFCKHFGFMTKKELLGKIGG